MAEQTLILDDRSSGNYQSSLGTSWRLITDTVMGGISSGALTLHSIGDKPCLRMRGDVRLENNGGFVQAALDLKDPGTLDASAYEGVLLEVYGNGETYNLHLRTDDVWLPWQSYRAGFQTEAHWQTIRLPFNTFKGYRIQSPLDTGHLKRIGIVAIGKAYNADLCLSKLALYAD